MFSKVMQTQDFAWKVLSAHLREKRLAHSYLFTGDEGSDKTELAICLASAINCEMKTFSPDCSCGSCLKTQNGTHPDFHWLGNDPKVKTIKIEEIRELISQASLKPYEGKCKIFAVMKAETMTADAANAFLKTLEEPPKDTYFILLADSRMSLMDTIISRCFEIRLKPRFAGVSPEDSAEWVAPRFWMEKLDAYEASTRIEVIQGLDRLMLSLRFETVKAAESSDPSNRLNRMLTAFERVCETKEAVDANANIKLSLTRLAMQLEKLFPCGKLSV